MKPDLVARSSRTEADRVPVDGRVGGFDRRTIGPAAALLSIWFIGALFIPWIDNRVPFDNPIVPGDVINIGAGVLTFTPAVGWNLETGVLLSDDAPSSPRAMLSESGVTYSVQVAPWPGTADELIDRMIDIDEKRNRLVARDERSRDTITNIDGVEGTVVHLTGVDKAVVMAGFVFDEPDNSGTFGVEIKASGNAVQLEAVADEIAAMISSTSLRVGDEEANS